MRASASIKQTCITFFDPDDNCEDGFIECDLCGGSGRIDCEECNGDGTLP